MSYQVEFTPRARKEQDAQEHVVRGRLMKALARLVIVVVGVRDRKEAYK